MSPLPRCRGPLALPMTVAPSSRVGGNEEAQDVSLAALRRSGQSRRVFSPSPHVPERRRDSCAAMVWTDP
jgi:hypothetical protein